MSGFQKQVNMVKPAGVRGDFADGNYNHMYALTLLAKSGDDVAIEIGKFAWDNGDGTASAIGEGKPTGLVHRTVSLPIMDITQEATMVVPARMPVPIMDFGSMLIEVSNAATVGEKIFVNNGTGEISSAAAGATVADSTETDYKIISLCENASSANQLVAVTNVNK